MVSNRADQSDPGDVLIEVDEPRFPGQYRGGQNVVDSLGHADDVGLDHRPKPVERFANGEEGLQGDSRLALERASPETTMGAG